MNRLSVVFLSAEFSGTFIHLENKTKQTYATFTGGRVVSDPERGGGGASNKSAMASGLPEPVWCGR